MKHNPTLANSNFTERAKEVLAFDQYGKLSAIFKSVYMAGNMLLMSQQGISNTCVGRTRSSNGLYFRHLHPNVVIESSDLGKLDIRDYDKVIGEYRLYKSTTEMFSDRENFINKTKK